jgi:hypothetical protein
LSKLQELPPLAAPIGRRMPKIPCQLRTPAGELWVLHRAPDLECPGVAQLLLSYQMPSL